VDCLFLVRHGVPFDVAFSLPQADRAAWVVVMGRFEGLDYNWTDGSWMAV
jgi:hypothetical protein